MSNTYWQGGEQVTLTRDMITAAWAQPGVSNSGRGIALANRAFDLYYHARRNIDACPDAAHKNAMDRELVDAATTGWGTGVDDLQEAFQHLASNGGRWTDEATENYYPQRTGVFPLSQAGAGIVLGPQAMVNFLDACDKKVKTLKDACEHFNTQTAILEQAQQADNWSRVGTVLGEVNVWGDRAKPFLWMAPATQERLGRVVGFAGTLGNIHSGLTTYVNARKAGMDQGLSAGLGALQTAIGWVPVLGGFYGKAIEMIPGLVTWYRGLLDDRIRRIDAASRG